MLSRVRFPTAQDVFDAYADLKQLVPPPADRAAPLDHVRALLASRRPAASILFLAHLLPRREAVWWARQCVGTILGPDAEDNALHAAEEWVRAPDEDKRRGALAAGAAGGRRDPTTWLALAAGWSGGSRSPPDQKPIHPAADACARAANAAIVLAVTTREPATIPSWIRACVDAGIRFAEGGEAGVSRSTQTASKP